MAGTHQHKFNHGDFSEDGFSFNEHFKFELDRICPLEDLGSYFMRFQVWCAGISKPGEEDISPLSHQAVGMHSPHYCLGECMVDLFTLASGPPYMQLHVKDSKGRRQCSLMFTCELVLLLKDWTLYIQDINVGGSIPPNAGSICFRSSIPKSDATWHNSLTAISASIPHPCVQLSKLLTSGLSITISLLSEDKTLLASGELLYRDILLDYKEGIGHSFRLTLWHGDQEAGIMTGSCKVSEFPPFLCQLVGEDVRLSPNLKSITGDAFRVVPGCLIAPNLPSDIPSV